MAKIGDPAINIFNSLVPNQDWKYGIKPNTKIFSGLVPGFNPIRAEDINELRDAFFNLAKLLSNDVSLSGGNKQLVNPFNKNQLSIKSGIAQVKEAGNSFDLGVRIDEENYAYNYIDVAPPEGYSMMNYVGGIASIYWTVFGGIVDDNDTLYTKIYKLDWHLRIVGGDSEMANYGNGNYGKAVIKYMTFWAKDFFVPTSSGIGLTTVRHDGYFYKKEG